MACWAAVSDPLLDRLLDLDLASADLYLSVVDLGSISKAAARHGLSQPSASQRIRKLERQLGLNLLDRSSSGSALTSDGRELAPFCRQLVTTAEVVLTEARTRRDQRRLHTRVVATAGLARHLVPDICGSLASATPPMSIEVTVADTLEACGLVRDGTVDLGLVDGPQPPLSMTSEIIVHRALSLVVGPGHRWAGRTRPVSAAELVTAPLLMRRRGSGTRDVIEDRLARSGHRDRPVPPAEAGTTEAQIATVALDPSMAAVIADDDVASAVAAGRLVAVPTELDFAQPVRLVWNGAEPHTPGARRFAQAALDRAVVGSSPMVPARSGGRGGSGGRRRPQGSG